MRAIGLVLAALPFLASCATAPVAAVPKTVLQLSVDPPAPARLDPGTVVKVTALPVPVCELAWVSGTVKILGAPTLGLKKDPADGAWKFRTMVPPMTTVPPGHYQVKAWGRTAAGADVAGTLDYEVE